MSWSGDEDDGVQQNVHMDNDLGVEQIIEMPEIKLFNKWTLSDVEVSDISLSASDFPCLLHTCCLGLHCCQGQSCQVD